MVLNCKKYSAAAKPLYHRILQSRLLGFVTRVVCGDHFGLLALWVTRLLSQWMLHWQRGNGSAARKLFPCIHSSTPSRRLDRPQVSLFKFSVSPESNSVYQFCWRVLNQLNHLAGSLDTCDFYSRCAYHLFQQNFNCLNILMISQTTQTNYCRKLFNARVYLPLNNNSYLTELKSNI